MELTSLVVEVARSLANVTHSLNTFQVHAIGIKRSIQYTQRKTTGDSMARIPMHRTVLLSLLTIIVTIDGKRSCDPFIGIK